MREDCIMSFIIILVEVLVTEQREVNDLTNHKCCVPVHVLTNQQSHRHCAMDANFVIGFDNTTGECSTKPPSELHLHIKCQFYASTT